MKQSPYEKFLKDQLILRDELAIDRTILANENAILAFIRTALAFFIAGASLIHFFGEFISQLVGYTLLLLGIITLGIGLKRYNAMQKEIKKIRSRK